PGDPGDRRVASVRERLRHRDGGRRASAARTRARHPVSCASRRIQRRTGNRRPSAGGARLALGVLDQRAGRPRRHLAGLVRASAHQGATRGQPRLERRGLIAPALTALIAVVNEGYAWGAASPAFVGCALGAPILLMLFVRSEQRAQDPLIDLALFQKHEFAAGNIAGFMCPAALFGLLLLMPFVLVRAYGDSTFGAGLRLTVIPVMLGAVSPLAGAFYDRLGARLLTVSAMLICVAALALLFAVLDGAPASLPAVTLALALFGLGQGLFLSPNNSAIMSAAPTSLTGEAGGLINLVRCCGISVGVAGASALL